MNKETLNHWQTVINSHPVLKNWTICDEDEVFDKYPFLKEAIKKFNFYQNKTLFCKKEKDGVICYRIVLYTKSHEYYFLFRGDYMSCGYNSRIEETLESWKRGGDLLYGKACRELFFKLLCEIIENELEKCPPWEYNIHENGIICSIN